MGNHGAPQASKPRAWALGLRALVWTPGVDPGGEASEALSIFHTKGKRHSISFHILICDFVVEYVQLIAIRQVNFEE